MSATSIFWGVLFGAFGMGYFIYGKKQRAVDNTILLLVIGVALMAVPYFVRI